MSPKTIILLGLALGCGLIAAVGINQIVARPTTDLAMVQVVVAKREIKKGDPIRPDDIRLQDWPAENVPQGAIDTVEKLQDKFTQVNILPGEPLMEAKLFGKADKRGITPEIPAGFKAVSVKVDNVSGGAGLILPGDNVDVLIYVQADMTKGVPVTTTKSLLKNIKVLAVDDVLDRPNPNEPSIPAKTVTLLVTNRQAALVTHGTEIGQIRLVMRSADGQDDAGSEFAVTTNDILNASSGVDPTAGGNTLLSGPIAPLPPVEAGPSLGSQIKEGAQGLRDLLLELKNARDPGGAGAEQKPFTVTLIEGPETRAVEFDLKTNTPLRSPLGGDLAPPTRAPAEPRDEAPTAAAPVQG